MLCQLVRVPLSLICLFVLGVAAAPAVGGPTAAQALALAPVQPGIEYTRPSANDIEQCEVIEDRANNAWVVRGPDGEVLRRYTDTNRDNVVDQWSYFLDGLEVYRDIDANYDNKADQYRWFHSAGTRWGIDENQDGKVDSWRVISPHEVAEEVVAAIQQKDQAAFARLLISEDELEALGAGETLRQQIVASRAEASSKFRKLVQQPKSISPEGEFADFGASRPSRIPTGADQSTKGMTVLENVSALVTEGAQPEQVQIGLMVKVGEAWRLVEAPSIGDEAVGLTVAATLTATTIQANAGAPNEQMQGLMSKLEQLDRLPTANTTVGRIKTIKQRARLLRDLAIATPKGTIRDQWFNQLADMFSAAIIDGEYDEADKMLSQLDEKCRQAGAGPDAQAHVRFQRLYADWVVKSQDPKVDYAKLQEDWRKTLQDFAKTFPGSPDTAEALLQLGMVDDLAGRDEQATKWYTQLTKDFDGSQHAAKAAGALRRLASPGKQIDIRGETLGGKRLALSDFRGKHVVVQYWATWCEPCQEDMGTLAEIITKYGKQGFAVLGVNLDSDRADARQFASSKRLPWHNLHEGGGLEGRLANEMGVINLPLMLLVDDQGKVISRNIRADEIEGQLKRVLR